MVSTTRCSSLTKTALEKRHVGVVLLLLVVAVAALQPTSAAITPSNTWTNITSSSTAKQTVSVVPFSVMLQSETKSLLSASTRQTASSKCRGWESQCSYYSGSYYSSYYQPAPTPCYPNYPNYPYGCNPNYPYACNQNYVYGCNQYYAYPNQYANQYQTATTTATSYSTVTETSFTISTTSIPNPVFITNTLTSTTATTDTTMQTVYGTLMGVFLVLFLATLFMLVRLRSTTASNPVPSQPQQAYIRTSHRCSACGTDVVLNAKFCGKCGVQLTAK